MSRAGLAKCHTAFFKRTVEHALMPNPQQKKINWTELQRVQTEKKHLIVKKTDKDELKKR